MEAVTKRNIHVYIDRNCVIRLRLGRHQQEDFLKSILISHSTLSYSFGIKRRIHSFPPVVPSKTLADSRPKWAKAALCLFSAENSSKTTPFGVAHTYVAYIREYPPDYFLLEGFNIHRFKLLSLLRTGSYCPIALSGHAFINICDDIIGASCWGHTGNIH